jgi:solute carrier family 13 (sodium-dependent dicarboxylate transporter), member 2/3/5
VQDERQAAEQQLKNTRKESVEAWLAPAKFLGSLLIALSVAWSIPAYDGLTPDGRLALFILLFSAGLWATEAIPAFAVALLALGLVILLLGGILFERQPVDKWKSYLATWGDPLIWLFLGGFVLAQGAEKTRLTHWFAHMIVTRAGRRPSQLLAGCMSAAFVFSMFISNTAATIMMVSVALPIVKAFHHADRFRCGLMLGIAVAANLGGMATLIGSPPNAIAAGALGGMADPVRVDFLKWMLFGAPPALVLVILAWFYLNHRYHSLSTFVDLSSVDKTVAPSLLPPWKVVYVMAVFTITVILWLTEMWHGVPVAAVSVLPICAFAAIGVMTSDDVCKLRWDVLLLIAGGLSLGLAVTNTGLAQWLVGLLPLKLLNGLGIAICLALVTTLLSNFMSNTAAASILVPIAIAASALPGSEPQIVLPIALAASAAMALPISTPPNAVVYSTDQVHTPEMIETGLLIGIIAPVLVALWCHWVLQLFPNLLVPALVSGG